MAKKKTSSTHKNATKSFEKLRFFGMRGVISGVWELTFSLYLHDRLSLSTTLPVADVNVKIKLHYVHLICASSQALHLEKQ